MSRLPPLESRGRQLDSRLMNASPLSPKLSPGSQGGSTNEYSPVRRPQSSGAYSASPSGVARGPYSSRSTGYSPHGKQLSSPTVARPPSMLEEDSEATRRERIKEVRDHNQDNTFRIMQKRYVERQLMRAQLEDEKERRALQGLVRRKKQESRWKRKLDRSPFGVDLVAENERLDEEIRVRERQEARRQKAMIARREKSKTEVIARALSEFSEVEICRAQRRIMHEEERMAKAKHDLERSLTKAQQRREDLKKMERRRKQRQQEPVLSPMNHTR